MTGTQQFYKTQGCSEREATLFSKYSKASKLVLDQGPASFTKPV